MKAIILKNSGGYEILKIGEASKPDPSPGQVLVKNQFIGINYAEVLTRKGLYGWTPEKPFILGMESSGIIEETGSNVDSPRIGQKVMVGTKYGAYAEYISVPSSQAIPVIEGYGMDESAAFLVNYLTAWISLFRMANVKKGEKVLITAAAGGVGSAAIQLCRDSGCEVYGLAGSKKKIDFLNGLNIAGAFNYNDKSWVDSLGVYCKGFDVVLELVGGDVNKKVFRLLNPFGRIVIAGFASLDLNKWNPLSVYRTYRDIPRFRVGDLAKKSAAVMSTHIGYLLEDNPGLLEREFNELKDFVTDRNIKPLVDKIFPFEEAAEAHKYMESRSNTGKILLKL